MIPFEQPPVCPESEEEEGAFDDLEDLVRNNRLISSGRMGCTAKKGTVGEWRPHKGAEKRALWLLSRSFSDELGHPALLC